eukprot:744195-Prorocentrum_lima.AAC.1
MVRNQHIDQQGHAPSCLFKEPENMNKKKSPPTMDADARSREQAYADKGKWLIKKDISIWNY